MSNILAVTAELKGCSIACKFEGKVFELNENLDSSTYLVKLAQDFCEKYGIDLTKIDRIITASGPGSFTGIRTAQSFVKGLSFALKIPAVIFRSSKICSDKKKVTLQLSKARKIRLIFTISQRTTSESVRMINCQQIFRLSETELMRFYQKSLAGFSKLNISGTPLIFLI